MSLLLSVVLITKNEEANLPRTLESVRPLVEDGQGEIIVVDSGSTDRTVEIARSFGARVFVEEWRGFAAQKNSAIEKAAGEWVFSLDADEELGANLPPMVLHYLERNRVWAWGDREKLMKGVDGLWLHRRNLFLGRTMEHGGTVEKKLRIFRRGRGRIKDVPVHEVVVIEGKSIDPTHWYHDSDTCLHHHAYPTLDIYLEHMRRYADLGAEMIKDKPRWWLWLNRWLNPPLTFFYNYVVRLGFLDGREGYLLHWNHRRYVGWKYERALELSRSPRSRGDAEKD